MELLAAMISTSACPTTEAVIRSRLARTPLAAELAVRSQKPCDSAIPIAVETQATARPVIKVAAIQIAATLMSASRTMAAATR